MWTQTGKINVVKRKQINIDFTKEIKTNVLCTTNINFSRSIQIAKKV